MSSFFIAKTLLSDSFPLHEALVVVKSIPLVELTDNEVSVLLAILYNKIPAVLHCNNE